MPEVKPDFNDPLWKLSAQIADAVSYCGPLQKIKLGKGKTTTTECIFGFQSMRATKLIHKILEQELPKLKRNDELSFEEFTKIVKGAKSKDLAVRTK